MKYEIVRTKFYNFDDESKWVHQWITSMLDDLHSPLTPSRRKRRPKVLTVAVVASVVIFEIFATLSLLGVF